jgi:ParB-like chromosome segregation protein Spo0J
LDLLGRGAGELMNDTEMTQPEPVFKWTARREAAALALATGHTEEDTAEIIGISRSTVSRWKRKLEFAQEVDRLSLMADIAGRAQRLRIAMRVVRDKMPDGVPSTDRDLLDWLKFAQSETDGVKLDLVKIQEALTDG